MKDKFDYNGIKFFSNVATSINHAVIDILSGTTASGTMNIPQTLYQQPQGERDFNASQLLIKQNEAMRPAEDDLTKAIHRLLEQPDSSEQVKKGNVIIVMHSNFYGSAVGGDVQQANLSFIEEWNQVKNDIDFDKLRSEFDKAIMVLQKNAKEDQHFTDLANMTFARDELNKADGPAMLRYLRQVGKFGLDIVKGIGVSLLVQLIMKV
jgi:hypothetical protein